MPVVVRNTDQSWEMPAGCRISAALLSVVAFLSTASAQQDGIPRQDVSPACLKAVLAEQELTRSLRQIRQPLPHITADESVQIRKDYSNLLYSGYSSAADTKTVRTYLEYQILQITDPEFAAIPSNGHQLLKEIQSDVQKAGSRIGNASNQLTMRRQFCKDILDICKKLLDNSFDARITAVSIMKYLQETRPATGGAAARLHQDALVALISVLNSDEQPDSVKVFAASSLRFVLRNCDVIETEQFRISDAVSRELQRACSQSAFQQTLLETLMEIQRPRRNVGGTDPTAMKAFVTVLSDRTRPVEVRCLAAQGVGRGAIDAQMNLSPISWKIAQLAGDVAQEFNRTPGDPKWPACGAALIFAYRHYTDDEAEGTLLERKGLSNRAGDNPPAAIADAAPMVQMVGMKLVRNSSTFTIQELTPLATWIRDSQPANLKWDNGQPAIPVD